MANRKPTIHDPARQPGKQAEARAAKRASYKGMTAAEIIRNMSDTDLAKAAKRCGGSQMAIYEQAYRARAPALYERCNERSEFERCCMIEADMEYKGGI